MLITLTIHSLKLFSISFSFMFLKTDVTITFGITSPPYQDLFIYMIKAVDLYAKILIFYFNQIIYAP